MSETHESLDDLLDDDEAWRAHDAKGRKRRAVKRVIAYACAETGHDDRLGKLLASMNVHELVDLDSMLGSLRITVQAEAMARYAKPPWADGRGGAQ